MGRTFPRWRAAWVLAAAAAWWVAKGPAAAPAATVAYWRFENNLLDASGSGNHAAATGTAFSTNLFGASVPQTGAANTRSLEFSNATGLASATHFLTVPHNSSLNIATGSFTIEAFVRLDANGSDPIRQYVLQKKDLGQVDNAASYAFLAKSGDLWPAPGTNQGVLALTLSSAGVQQVIFSTLGIDNADWHHISVALDGPTGNVRFTLDDQVDLQLGVASSFVRQDNTQSLFIGAHPTGNAANPPNQGFDGHLDELRISNTFLATGQLLAVPEPASWSLLAAGALAVVCWRGRRRLRQAGQW